MVADFMGVLHYVTYKNDAHIGSYPSEPVLTFGASRLWYQLDPPAFETHILRQFKVMLMQVLAVLARSWRASSCCWPWTRPSWATL